MVQLKVGATRLVVVLPQSPYVYKVGRVRPFKTVLKMMAILVSSRHYYALQEKYHPHILRALWRYLWAGIYANQAEYRYWCETHDSRCAPVVGLWWGGVLITQVRLAPVTKAELQASPLAQYAHHREIGGVHQYGKTAEGKILLVDYAILGDDFSQGRSP